MNQRTIIENFLKDQAEKGFLLCEQRPGKNTQHDEWEPLSPFELKQNIRNAVPVKRPPLRYDPECMSDIPDRVKSLAIELDAEMGRLGYSEWTIGGVQSYREF